MTADNGDIAAIILHGGDYDRASYALSLALVALASGMEVHLLLTYGGLKRFVKDGLSVLGEETGADVRASLERGLASGGIAGLEDQLREARKLGLRLHACPTAMAHLNIARGDLREEVDDVMGLAAFLALARAARINWYI
ncbi:MAG: DsrE family protein [Chloroflexi bacterium]|nr:DsrE family protein [Chloroflexota bacterium]